MTTAVDHPELVALERNRRRPFWIAVAAALLVLWMLVVTAIQINAKYDDKRTKAADQVLIDKLATVIDQANKNGANVATPEQVVAATPGSATVTGVGPQGARGEAGTPGAPGPAGPEGARGPQGFPGDQGLQGESGVPGVNGKDGINGTNGVDGGAGATGVAGPTGPEGVAGAAGPQGTPGANGIDGAQGLAGPAGPQGVAGPAGADGAPGANGAAGAPGSPGAPGTIEGLIENITVAGVNYTCTVTAGVCNFVPA